MKNHWSNFIDLPCRQLWFCLFNVNFESFCLLAKSLNHSILRSNCKSTASNELTLHKTAIHMNIVFFVCVCVSEIIFNGSKIQRQNICKLKRLECSHTHSTILMRIIYRQRTVNYINIEHGFQCKTRIVWMHNSCHLM